MSQKYLKQSIIALLSLGLIFLANSFIWAWTAPTQNPPAGNVAAPLNVSAIQQTKSGNLNVFGLNITGGLNYWISKHYDSFALKNNDGFTRFVLGQDGHVGIGGLLDPSQMLEVKGDIRTRERDAVTWRDLGDQGDIIGQNSMIVYKGKLYVGINESGMSRCTLKSYDGFNWTVVGEFNDMVFSTIIYDNNLYVGFGTGQVRSYDGSSWKDLGRIINSNVRSMAVYKDILYIGGGAGQFMYYDGSSWWNVSSPLGGFFTSMIVYGYKNLLDLEYLFFGKSDLKNCWFDINGIDSSSPSIHCDPAEHYILSMAVYKDGRYAGFADGKLRRYDFTSNVYLGSFNPIYSMAVYDDKLYFGDGSTVMSYDADADDSKWKNLGNHGSDVKSMAVYGGKLYIGLGNGVVKELADKGVIRANELSVEGKIIMASQTDDLDSDDTVVTKGYVDDRVTYIVPRYMRGTTISIPESIIVKYCGDDDGCELRLGMYNWDGNKRTASRKILFFYNANNLNWRSEWGDWEGTNNNNITQHIINSWACYFTDGKYVNWISLGDSDLDFGLFSWNQYTAECRITIID